MCFALIMCIGVLCICVLWSQLNRSLSFCRQKKKILISIVLLFGNKNLNGCSNFNIKSHCQLNEVEQLKGLKEQSYGKIIHWKFNGRETDKLRGTNLYIFVEENNFKIFRIFFSLSIKHIKDSWLPATSCQHSTNACMKIISNLW